MEMKLYADEEDQVHGQFTKMKMNYKGVEKDFLVSEKWLQIKKIENEMKREPGRWVKINFAGPRGERIEYLEIGTDIEPHEIEEKLDPETHELFGIYFFEGESETLYVVQKWMWDQLKVDISTLVEEEVKNAMYGSNESKTVEEIHQRYTQEGLKKSLEERIRKSRGE